MEPALQTPHFRVVGDRVQLRADRAGLDNDLAELIVTELAPLGLVPDAAAFERVFVAVVEASAPSPPLAWFSFYDNTLARLREHDAVGSTGGVGPIAAFRRIYRVALARAAGDVLDLGSCFGFFPLLLAERAVRGARALGTDVTPGTVRLAASIAAARGSPARFVVADARRLPAPDRSFDTVTAIHLLEHLHATDGQRVLEEAMRVARARVLVAVPLESVPGPAYGHVRAFALGDLAGLGRQRDWRATVWEADGGWLQLDRTRPASPLRSGRTHRAPSASCRVEKPAATIGITFHPPRVAGTKEATVSEADERGADTASEGTDPAVNPDLHGQAREVVEGASEGGPAPTPGGG